MNAKSQLENTMAMLNPFYENNFYGNFTHNKNILFGGKSNTIFSTLAKYMETTRSYQIGDSAAFIDWKAYARHEHLIVREVKENTKIKVLIVIDLNETMYWPKLDDKKIVPKIDLAIRVALHLANMFLQFQDKVSFAMILSKDGKIKKSNVYSSEQIVLLYEKLQNKTMDLREFPLQENASRLEEEVCDIAAYISDAIHLEPNVLKLGAKLSVFFHVLSSLDIDLDWIDFASKYYPNLGFKKSYWGKELRENLAEEVFSWKENLCKNLKALGFSYFFLTDKTLLIDYFKFLDLLFKK